MKKWVFFGLMLLWGLHPAAAQQVGRQFSHLTTLHGLPHKSVWDIFQDSREFMWFCTQEGLTRYDGYSFKTYRNDPTDPFSLSGELTQCITEDKQGNLWVGNAAGQGLNRFDRKTGNFTRLRHKPNNSSSLADESILCLLTDKDGFIWIGSKANGLDRLDPVTQKITHFSFGDGTRETSALFIKESKLGDIWIGFMMEGVARLNKKTGRFTRYLVDPTRKSKAANVVFDLEEDRNGIIWLATAAGVFILNPSSGVVTASPAMATVKEEISSVVGNTNGELWFGGKSGLWVLNPETNTVVRYEHDPQNPASLSKGPINQIFQDKAGAIWIATVSSGLTYYDPKQAEFQLYSFPVTVKGKPRKAFVTAVHEDQDGELWVGVKANGIRRYNRSSGAITAYRFNPADTNSLSTDKISCFVSDKEGILWIGTEHGVLNKFDKKTGKFTRYKRDSTNTTSKGCSYIFSLCDAGKYLWVGTSSGGIERFDKTSGTFLHFPLNSEETKHEFEKSVAAIAAEADGSLWLATLRNGLYHLNPQSGKYTRYRHSESNSGSLSFNNVVSLLVDSRGTLWVGTWGGGLYRFDKNTNTFHSYTLKNGLPSNSVFGIVEDKQQRLWLSTSKGLSCFNPVKGTFKNYDVQDGLQDNEFFPNSTSYRSPSGEIFFSGVNGLTAFFPDQILENKFLPPVQITDFQLIYSEAKGEKSEAEKFLLSRNITEIDSITLSFKDNIFSIGFAGLNFTDSDENQYAYQLVGFHKDWINSGNSRLVTFTNLDPGSYIFRVKASNNDGVWNDKVKELHITILPPPWRTWWAYSLYVLAFAGLLFGLRRYWKGKERLKADLKLKQLESDKLQEMDQLKSHFFTNISHEFRTPLTLILGPLEQLLAKSGIEDNLQGQFLMMHRNGSRLLQLINQLLDISKLESGSMKLKASEYDLMNFMRPLVYSFSSLAETRNISLNFNSAVSTLPVYFDADMLEKIVVNLMSNALKFTSEGGHITVSITEAEGSAVLSVKDTGIGITSTRLNKIFNRFYQVEKSQTRYQEGTGIGLALVKELVQLHQGDIAVESEEGVGSTFTVMLPLGHAHLKPEQIAAPDAITAKFQLIPEPRFLPAKTIEEEGMDAGDIARLPVLLIVEDNEDVLTFIGNQFSEKYKVLQAINGKQGLAIAIEQVPDLVISDLMMPEMDGIELCQQLKTDERTSHIPVILLTAKAAIESKLHGLETGADDYLTKPFQPQELLVRVRNLIAQRLKLREKYTGRILKLEPGEVAVASKDEQFLQRAIAVVEMNLARKEFDVEAFCREIGMSRVQLHRKLRALTGQSTSEFVRNLRLKRASQLLEQEAGNIAEIAYQTGFQSLSYFSKSFKEMYGCRPSEFCSFRQKTATAEIC